MRPLKKLDEKARDDTVQFEKERVVQDYVQDTGSGGGAGAAADLRLVKLELDTDTELLTGDATTQCGFKYYIYDKDVGEVGNEDDRLFETSIGPLNRTNIGEYTAAANDTFGEAYSFINSDDDTEWRLPHVHEESLNVAACDCVEEPG